MRYDSSPESSYNQVADCHTLIINVQQLVNTITDVYGISRLCLLVREPIGQQLRIVWILTTKAAISSADKKRPSNIYAQKHGKVEALPAASMARECNLRRWRNDADRASGERTTTAPLAKVRHPRRWRERKTRSTASCINAWKVLVDKVTAL